MCLYSRERVATWVAEHQDLLQKAEPRRAASRKAVETKREGTREQLAGVMQRLRLRPAPSREKLERQVSRFLADRYEDYSGEVSEKAICSYLRHNYTNYEAILNAVKGRVGKGEFYYAVKALLCCRIVEHYGLKVDPLVAAFGSVMEVPKWLQEGDPEVAACGVLGIEADGVPAGSVAV